MKKQTKNGFILLMIATIIAIQFSACKKNCSEITTEKVAVTGKINGIIIEGPWEVTVTQDSVDNSAELEYCTCMNNKVSAKLLPNGYLHIKVTSWDWNNNCCKIFRAIVKATTLETIEASGAAGIRAYGNFDSLNKIILSGASTINGLSGEGTSAIITLSGASTLRDFTFNGNSIDAEISGASTFSGSGYVTHTNFIASGASDIKTLNLESENLDIDLSGASEAQVTVNNTIKGRLAGASTLKYRRATDVSGVHISGGSKIIKID
jgi:hypothetical protein